jgi:hypothetical protein
MEPSMAMRIMMADWKAKLTTYVKSVMETKSKTMHQSKIEWKTRWLWILLRSREPARNPMDLQKKRREY